jgi:S-adenosylmethionine synthetase
MARYVAKNVVAADLAGECELQLAYCIGVPEPVSINISCNGTNKVPEENLVEDIKKVFDFRPAQIIAHLNLRRPIFRQTAAYGHFGREEDLDSFTWERKDQTRALQAAL